MRRGWLWKASPENGYVSVGRQVDMPPQLHPQAEDTARERPEQGALDPENSVHRHKEMEQPLVQKSYHSMLDAWLPWPNAPLLDPWTARIWAISNKRACLHYRLALYSHTSYSVSQSLVIGHLSDSVTAQALSYSCFSLLSSRANSSLR